MVSKHWYMMLLVLATAPRLYAKTVTFINKTGVELKIEFVGVDRYNADRRWQHIRYVPPAKDHKPFVIKTRDMKENAFRYLAYTMDGFKVSAVLASPYTDPLMSSSKLWRLDNHTVYEVSLVAGECVVKIVPQGFIASWYTRIFAPYLLAPTEYPLGRRELLARKN